MLKLNIWKKRMNLYLAEAYDKVPILIELNYLVEEAKLNRDFESFKRFRCERNSLSEELKSFGIVVSELSGVY